MFPSTTSRASRAARSEEHTSELQSLRQLVCRLLLEKKNGVLFGSSNAHTGIRQMLVDENPLEAVIVPDGVLFGSSNAHTGIRQMLVDDFFFNDTASTDIYTLSLHDALPIYRAAQHRGRRRGPYYFHSGSRAPSVVCLRSEEHTSELQSLRHLVCRLLLE